MSATELKAAAAALAKADRTLARVIARVGPPDLVAPRRFVPFEALTSSIAHQQLNGTAAKTILTRFKVAFGDGGWPTPEAVLAARMPALRKVGLSRSKSLALKDLAHKVLDGTVPPLPTLRAMSDEAIIEQVTRVRGIGPWTVQMMLMFRLGRLDVMPIDDFGVRKGFTQLYRRPAFVTPRQLLEHSERWRPYRSVASWYLWRVLDV